MVTYETIDARRGRSRNRRIVTLQGTIEAEDADDSVPLDPSAAGVESVESAAVETTVVGDGLALAGYDRETDTVEFYDDNLTANADDLTDDTFVVTVTGTV